MEGKAAKANSTYEEIMDIYVVSNYKVGSEHNIEESFRNIKGALDYVKKQYGTRMFKSQEFNCPAGQFEEYSRFNNGVDYVVIITRSTLK